MLGWTGKAACVRPHTLISILGPLRTPMWRYRTGASALCAAPLRPGRYLSVGLVHPAQEKSRPMRVLGLADVLSITRAIFGRQGGYYGVSHVASTLYTDVTSLPISAGVLDLLGSLPLLGRPF